MSTGERLGVGADEVTEQVATGGLGSGLLARAGGLRSAGIVIPFMVLFLVLTITSSSFATSTNLLNILDQQASTLIIAAAGTLVLVSGGIDLSVGAVYTLGAVIAGELALHMASGPAILIGVLAGFAVGMVNGVISTIFRINSLIATLAMSFVIAGLASLITAGNLVVLFTHPSFGDLARTSIFTIHSSIWIMVLVVVVLALYLARTTTGRYMYATGGNQEAARIAGVRVNLVRIVS
ncbi:MAG: ABC transporter permease, partial [Solirubrobacteraceae bacterium]